MPTVQISQGLAVGPQIMDQLFERMMRDATVLSSAPDGAMLALSTTTITLAGRGLTYGGPGEPVLTGGVLTGMLVAYRPGYEVDFRDMALDGAALAAAARAEAADDRATAFERLIHRLSWEYAGNSTSEDFPTGAVNVEGNRVVLHGNDRVTLEFGADRFNAGPGNDVVFGGAGGDWLGGGTGIDRLYGGAHDDTINAGAGNDRLFGGHGDDLLLGAAGDDWLQGGIGRDRLWGGAGRDSFVFASTGRGERDVVQDFEPGIDRILVTSDGPTALSDTAAGALFRYGAESILIAGVSTAELGGEDIVVLT